MKNILLKPLITEKTMSEAVRGKYTFVVGLTSDKKEIALEVEKNFKVTVTRVTTIILKGKMHRGGAKKMKIEKKPWKKAIVALVQGQKIDLFDTVGAEK